MANRRGVAPNTVAAYHNDLRQFEEYVRSSQTGAAQDSGSGTVAGFLLYLKERDYAQATVARKVAAVKSFFHYASENGLVGENPAAGLDSPRVRRGVPRAAETADVHALLETGCSGTEPDDLRDRAMFSLLYHSGMRVSEIVALDVNDVNLEGAVVLCRGRGGRVRSIPMGDEAARLVDDYQREGRPFLLRGQDQETEALFLNHRGTRLTRQGFWLIMKSRARQAGVTSPLTPHAVRHAFALRHLDRGTTLRDLKELLGHVNISTTQIYTLASREAHAAGARSAAQLAEG
jgi:integrase/recombinase XerD